MSRVRLARAFATVGGYTLASRALGFARDVLIAAALGAGPVADAFFVAFRLPNLFRRLFAEGAFAAAFVPMFTEILAKEGRGAARRFGAESLSAMVAALSVFCAAMQVAMPWVMLGLAPGFADEPAKFADAVTFGRIAFPYLLFVSLVAHLGGALNALGRFAAAAAAPILLNLVLIAFLLAASPFLPSPGHALAWGVFAAGIVQFLWTFEACRRAGMAFRLPRPRLGGRVRTLLVRILPGAVGAGAAQVNLVVGTILASLLPTGAVSWLYYADRVYQLPLGVVGAAVGTALLPLLSRQIGEGRAAEARQTLNRAVELAMLLTLPAAAALLTIPGPIVAVLFERGAFAAADSRAAAAALAGFAVGLPAFVLVRALAPGFFARGDVAMPARIGVASVAVNVALAVALLRPFGHVGLALATSAAAWFNAGLLAWVLARRGHLAPDRRLRGRLARMLAAAGVMAAVLAGARLGLESTMDGSAAARAAGLAALVLAGAAAYAAAALWLRAAAPGELRRALGRGGA